MKLILRIFILLGILNILIACAKVGHIEGGPKDTTPPKIDSSKSTPNFLTHFKPGEITLVFDEFVSLKAPYTNIVISPPLIKKFKIINKAKKVVLKFDDEEPWKEDASYIIQLGDAIVDYTEGNPAKNLSFVFSTGDDIDSLELSGQVVDAITGKGVKDVLIMLYDRQEDTLPVREKPYYFKKTEGSGTFHFKYLKRDSFMLVALKDENFNYKYDLPKEQIGFLDTLVIPGDSTSSLLIKISTPRPKLRVISTKSGHGMFKISFNSSPVGCKVCTLGGDTVDVDIDMDTMKLYLESFKGDSLPLIIFSEDKPVDTVVYHPLIKEFSLPSGLKVKRSEPFHTDSETGWLLYPNQWMVPARKAMTLKRDSLEIADSLWTMDAGRRQGPWTLNHRWSFGHKYRLYFYPGALRNADDTILKDTLIAPLPVLNPEDLSGLTVKFINVSPSKHILIHLISEEKLIRQWCFTVSDSIMTHHWSLIKPGNYELRIIEDLNANCLWDPADWWQRRQPEPVIIKKIDKLRANWDAEVQIEGI